MTVISVIDPGLNFLPVLVAGAVLVIGLAALWVGDREDISTLFGAGAFVSVLSGVFCVAYLLTGVSTTYQAQLESAQEAAMEKIGYANVSVEEGEFVASLNGQYVEGTLTDLPGDKWEIKHIVNPGE